MISSPVGMICVCIMFVISQGTKRLGLPLASLPARGAGGSRISRQVCPSAQQRRRLICTLVGLCSIVTIEPAST